jgi:hypothetical protein
MIIDWYGELILTVIATCLVVIAFKPIHPISEANAQRGQEVRLINANEIARCIFEMQRAGGNSSQIGFDHRYCRD